MLVAHTLAMGLALAVALLCPRPGAPALLVSVPGGGIGPAIIWAEREGARFVSIDTDKGEVVALLPSHGSLMSALAAGLVPIAADASGCTYELQGENAWKN